MKTSVHLSRNIACYKIITTIRLSPCYYRVIACSLLSGSSPTNGSKEHAWRLSCLYIIRGEKGTPRSLGRELPLESSQKHEGSRSSKRKRRHCWVRSASLSLDLEERGVRSQLHWYCSHTSWKILFSHLLKATFIDRRRNQIDRTKVWAIVLPACCLHNGL